MATRIGRIPGVPHLPFLIACAYVSPAREGSQSKRKRLLRSRSSRPAGHFAGTWMCRVHSPLRGRAISTDGCRVCSVQDARDCLEGPDIVRKRWAEPRSLRGPQGGGSPRLTRAWPYQHGSYQGRDGSGFGHLEIEGIRTNPRDASSRGFFVAHRACRVGIERCKRANREGHQPRAGFCAC